MYIDLWILFFLIINIFVLTCCINCNNPIYSVVFLMVAFVNTFLVLSYLGHIFVPLIIMFIYGGAMAILLLFVLMILDIKVLYVRDSFFYFNILFICWVSSIIVSLFLHNFYFFVVVYKYASWRIVDFISVLYFEEDLRALGFFLYNFNFLPFVIVSIVLLVSLIGSISVVIYKFDSNRRQSTMEQLKGFFDSFNS